MQKSALKKVKLLIGMILPMLSLSEIHAQELINLVKNGDFEDGNKGFISDFIYTENDIEPGTYGIGNKMARRGEDFANPQEGDHSTGAGSFLLVNSDDYKNKAVWKAKIKVAPYGMYSFSVAFCNLYKHKNSNSGFVINGFDMSRPQSQPSGIQLYVNNKPLDEPEKDIYHLHKWVVIQREWYSDTINGYITIEIYNTNHQSNGNDLAIDDVAFVHLKQMPKTYKHKPKNTAMILPNMGVKVDNRLKYYKNKTSAKFNAVALGDSISPGIYSLYKTPKVDPIQKPQVGERRILNKVSFSQGSAELSTETKKELDNLYTWLMQYDQIKIRIEGHTDNQGDPYLNIGLSENRVLNVKNYLIERGISPERLQVKGYGGARPIADNSREAGRILNRRVEFEVIE